MSTVRRSSVLRPAINGVNMEDFAKKERERAKMKRLAAKLSPEGAGSDDSEGEDDETSVDSVETLEKVGAEFTAQAGRDDKVLPAYDRGQRKKAIGNLNIAIRRKSVTVAGGGNKKGKQGSLHDQQQQDERGKQVSYELIDLTGTQESERHKEMIELSRSAYRAEKQLERLLKAKEEESKKNIEDYTLRIMKNDRKEEARQTLLRKNTEVKENFVLEVDRKMQEQSQISANVLFTKKQIEIGLPTWFKTMKTCISVIQSCGHTNKLKWRSQATNLLKQCIIESQADPEAELTRIALRDVVLKINRFNAMQLVAEITHLKTAYIERAQINETHFGKNSRLLSQNQALLDNKGMIPLLREDWSAQLDSADYSRKSMALHSTDSLSTLSRPSTLAGSELSDFFTGDVKKLIPTTQRALQQQEKREKQQEDRETIGKGVGEGSPSRKPLWATTLGDNLDPRTLGPNAEGVDQGGFNTGPSPSNPYPQPSEYRSSNHPSNKKITNDGNGEMKDVMPPSMFTNLGQGQIGGNLKTIPSSQIKGSQGGGNYQVHAPGLYKAQARGVMRMRSAAAMGNFELCRSLFKHHHDTPAQINKNKRSVGKQPPSMEAFRILMIAFKNAPDLRYEDAFEVIDLIESYGLTPDTTIYNIMMRSCERESRWRRALAIYKDMTTLHNCTPNVQTFDVLIDCCRHSLEEPAVIYDELRRYKLPHDYCYKASLTNAGNRVPLQVMYEAMYAIDEAGGPDDGRFERQVAKENRRILAESASLKPSGQGTQPVGTGSAPQGGDKALTTMSAITMTSDMAAEWDSSTIRTVDNGIDEGSTVSDLGGVEGWRSPDGNTVMKPTGLGAGGQSVGGLGVKGSGNLNVYHTGSTVTTGSVQTDVDVKSLTAQIATHPHTNQVRLKDKQDVFKFNKLTEQMKGTLPGASTVHTRDFGTPSRPFQVAIARSLPYEPHELQAMRAKEQEVMVTIDREREERKEKALAAKRLLEGEGGGQPPMGPPPGVSGRGGEKILPITPRSEEKKEKEKADSISEDNHAGKAADGNDATATTGDHHETPLSPPGVTWQDQTDHSGTLKADGKADLVSPIRAGTRSPQPSPDTVNRRIGDTSYMSTNSNDGVEGGSSVLSVDIIEGKEQSLESVDNDMLAMALGSLSGFRSQSSDDGPDRTNIYDLQADDYEHANASKELGLKSSRDITASSYSLQKHQYTVPSTFSDHDTDSVRSTDDNEVKLAKKKKLFAKWQEKVDNMELNDTLLQEASSPVARYWEEDLDSLASFIEERAEEKEAAEKRDREKRHGGIPLKGGSVDSMEGLEEDMGLDPGLNLWESQVTYDGSPGSHDYPSPSPTIDTRSNRGTEGDKNQNKTKQSRNAKGTSKFSKLGKFLTSSQQSDKTEKILYKHATGHGHSDNKDEKKSGGTGTGNPTKTKFRHRTHQTLTKDLTKLVDSKAIMRKVEQSIEYGFEGFKMTHLV